MTNPFDAHVSDPGDSRAKREIVAELEKQHRDLPAMRKLTIPQRKAVIAYTLRDPGERIKDVARHAGVHPATIPGWRAKAWWRPALIACVRKIESEGFVLLNAAIAREAERLAQELTTGERRLRDLTREEMQLIRMRQDIEKERSVRVSDAEGNSVEITERVRGDTDLSALVSLGASNLADTQATKRLTRLARKPASTKVDSEHDKADETDDIVNLDEWLSE